AGRRHGKLTGIHKIQHVVMIMQENRSLDSYFGTYPGADGIPMKGGVPTVCSPDPKSGRCVRPYHDPSPVNTGGPHGASSSVTDVNGGSMNGFVRAAIRGIHRICHTAFDPQCANLVANPI